MKELKVVYALITNSHGEVLLVLNSDNNEWSLPGGKVEPQETLECALKREVYEETGLSCEVGDVVSINEAQSSHYQLHTLFIMFKATITNTEIATQKMEEIKDVQWFTIRQADQLLTYYEHSLHQFLTNHATYYDEGILD
ncbi:NUDIX hydrolase [Staphylococcus simiae]|uniref:NUDIX hydrolase n=1 Tax=Staphylococcus simiae TaxID=308354 RepID=UPI001A963833|nr:NUDIX hydrolase [Staphylococcus simiae]MBO1199230.1 NUDIX hydrolase [Staphylococcus simiae]MBO1201430.1 NUDIX hydrolase [Staphylococcus simiae]MBO1203601.1 NUDIX hydrolase [Staphylococcus simiae]MBO1211201.1 NUDIX hydrolase [Staphylococcus simiae]MBO1229835.1 NUDIX hydrolase [Staphylococcus simiae]